MGPEVFQLELLGSFRLTAPKGVRVLIRPAKRSRVFAGDVGHFKIWGMFAALAPRSVMGQPRPNQFAS